jgi:hypothetical protein
MHAAKTRYVYRFALSSYLCFLYMSNMNRDEMTNNSCWVLNILQHISVFILALKP